MSCFNTIVWCISTRHHLQLASINLPLIVLHFDMVHDQLLRMVNYPTHSEEEYWKLPSSSDSIFKDHRVINWTIQIFHICTHACTYIIINNAEHWKDGWTTRSLSRRHSGADKWSVQIRPIRNKQPTNDGHPTFYSLDILRTAVSCAGVIWLLFVLVGKCVGWGILHFSTVDHSPVGRGVDVEKPTKPFKRVQPIQMPTLTYNHTTRNTIQRRMARRIVFTAIA